MHDERRRGDFLSLARKEPCDHVADFDAIRDPLRQKATEPLLWIDFSPLGELHEFRPGGCRDFVYLLDFVTAGEFQAHGIIEVTMPIVTDSKGEDDSAEPVLLDGWADFVKDLGRAIFLREALAKVACDFNIHSL